MTYIAALTTINEQRDTGTWDTLTVFDAAGNEVESISVRPADNDGPYIEALINAGWAVTGTTGRRLDVTGNHAFTVDR